MRKWSVVKLNGWHFLYYLYLAVTIFWFSVIFDQTAESAFHPYKSLVLITRFLLELTCVTLLETLGTLSNEDGNVNDDGSKKSHF